jgi:DNA-directed RNA polymerase specialized sigma24 family protein
MAPAPQANSGVANAGSVSGWIAQAKQGDELALTNLHRRYWPQLVALARQRLQASPIPSDEEDVAQQAFFGFYEAIKHQRVPRLENRHQFLALLSHIIACKACNRVRHELSQRKGSGRVRGEPGFIELIEDANHTPLQEAILRDCYQKYVGELPEGLRRYAELFLQGHTRQEIARQIGCVDRTVDRKIMLLKQYWQNVAERCVSHTLSSL